MHGVAAMDVLAGNTLFAVLDDDERRELAGLLRPFSVAGDEVLQLYVRGPASRAVRPVRELKAFERVSLAPGERRQVRFTLTATELETLDDRLRPALASGRFQVWVGTSSVGGLAGTLDVEAR